MRILTDRRALAIAAALAVAFATRSAHADPDKTCVLDGASIMAFGIYDPENDSPLDVEGRISYRCFSGTRTLAPRIVGSSGQVKSPLNVQITLGTGGAGSYNRYMSGGREKLSYNLYLDAQRTRIWGDGTAGTQIYAAKGQPNNHVVVVPVFGRVFAGQDVASDFYLDQLIVTLDF